MMDQSVLFICNYPSPYRVDFWNELGKHVQLTVVFTETLDEQTHRSTDWFKTDFVNFEAHFLSNIVKIGKLRYYRDIFSIIRKGYSHIIIGGYASPTMMLAIDYMRSKRIDFYMEADGGLIIQENIAKYYIKKHFISGAKCWLSSGKATTSYFLHYGAKPDAIIPYYFSSQWEKDLENANRLRQSNRAELRAQLGVTEQYMLLSVGRFSYNKGYGKGYDVLCKAASKIDRHIGVYIIGDEPTNEFLKMKENMNLTNVHFIGFKKKDDLAYYYAASDVFILLTRSDVWGLVINEAMSFGLPVITTDKCGAGISLIENGYNGYIVPAGDIESAEKAISEMFSNPQKMVKMGVLSRERISKYTIENMVEAHLKFFKDMHEEDA